MRKLFGTDGIRGTANLDPMTSEMAMQLGRAAAHIFMRRAGRHQIVIGKDTRISGYMLESALTSGICSTRFLWSCAAISMARGVRRRCLQAWWKPLSWWMRPARSPTSIRPRSNC